MKKKVIVDCDVGVDDALALILAFHSPELEVKGITAVNGNVPLERVLINLQKVLSLIRPQQRPIIAKGADHPLRGEPRYSHSVHGEDGLGEARINQREGEEWWQIFPGRADELITRMARQYPGEITLIAVGPLTNLALALREDPQGMRQLKEVVVMGGAVRVPGNVTPFAEFNIYVDPLAAQMVFESGLPVTLVPLDVTHQVFLSLRVIEERVRPFHNLFSQFVVEATGYDSQEGKFRAGARSLPSSRSLGCGGGHRPRFGAQGKTGHFRGDPRGETLWSDLRICSRKSGGRPKAGGMLGREIRKIPGAISIQAEKLTL